MTKDQRAVAKIYPEELGREAKGGKLADAWIKRQSQ